MPLFALPITPTNSRSPSSTPPQSPPRAPATTRLSPPTSPPRGAEPSPPRSPPPASETESHPDCGVCRNESHPDCRACRRTRSPSPPKEPQPQAAAAKPAAAAPAPAQEQPKLEFTLASLQLFAENNPLIAGIIGTPLIFLCLYFITFITPYHYLSPESFPPEQPPHPDDTISQSIEAAFLRASSGGSGFPPRHPQQPTFVPVESKWISFSSYLLIQIILTIFFAGPLRRLIGYWAFWPIHVRGTREPIFPDEARPTLGGVDPLPRLMTIWFFIHPRPENFVEIGKVAALVMVLFCGVDSFSFGGLGRWMAGTGLGKLVPFGLVTYAVLVVLVFTVNEYKLVKAVIIDILFKVAQVVWTLVGQWGVLLARIFWTFEGVVALGGLGLGGLVFYTLGMPWDDELREPIRTRMLVGTSASLMGVADLLFDLAGVGVKGVVADFRAASCDACKWGSV
ncbi:hypothetical protein V8F33_009108 [Rhypophila sp. PSN 637]